MVSIRLVMVAAVAAIGCGKQLNAEYCAAHPNDGDCRDAGLVVIDAPPACTRNSDCAANMATSVCDTASGQCVQCTPDNNVCPMSAPKCGMDELCHGCLVDADCPAGTGSNATGVCLASGMCTTADKILYVRPGGSPQSDCLIPTPGSKCNLATALGKVTTTDRHIIQMDPGDYIEGPLTITGITVALEGPATGAPATISDAADGPVVTVTGAGTDVTLSDVTLQLAKGATGDGLDCSASAKATLHHTVITNNPAKGVVSSGCTVTMDRSTVTANTKGALDLAAGELQVFNNFIRANGDGSVTTGNVHITNATGKLKFNSIASNLAGTGQAISGVGCSPAAGGTFLVFGNIIAGNQTGNKGGNQTSGTCTLQNNYVSDKTTDVGFASATDLHLTAASPLVSTNGQPPIVNNGQTDAECHLNATMYIDDIDGNARPVGACDLGADEYKP